VEHLVGVVGVLLQRPRGLPDEDLVAERLPTYEGALTFVTVICCTYMEYSY
jgi:hypothetical protein